MNCPTVLQASSANRILRRLLLVGGVMLVIASTGCTSMNVAGLNLPGMGANEDMEPSYIGTSPGYSIDASMSEKSYHAVRQAKTQNSIVLQVMGDRDPIRVLPLPSEGQSVLVSDLLRQSGLQKKFNHLDVVVFRAETGVPGGIRLEVKMDSSGKSVQPVSDYALQPGDRIQVRQLAKADALQTLLGGVLGG